MIPPDKLFVVEWCFPPCSRLYERDSVRKFAGRAGKLFPGRPVGCFSITTCQAASLPARQRHLRPRALPNRAHTPWLSRVLGPTRRPPARNGVLLRKVMRPLKQTVRQIHRRLGGLEI